MKLPSSIICRGKNGRSEVLELPEHMEHSSLKKELLHLKPSRETENSSHVTFQKMITTSSVSKRFLQGQRRTSQFKYHCSHCQTKRHSKIQPGIDLWFCIKKAPAFVDPTTRLFSPTKCFLFKRMTPPRHKASQSTSWSGFERK